MTQDIIFIHIPKTAGQSIQEGLPLDFYCASDEFDPDNYKNFNNAGISYFGHYYIPDLIREGIISEEYFKNAFKFCFVRNPWERVVSLYTYLLDIADLHIETTFKVFMSMLDTVNIHKPGLYNRKGLSQCNQQLEWITDDRGNIFVDYIGRLENIEEDWREICNKTNIPHKTLPHKNKRNRPDSIEFFNQSLADWTRGLYSDDIEEFGYEFNPDNKPLPNNPKKDAREFVQHNRIRRLKQRFTEEQFTNLVNQVMTEYFIEQPEAFDMLTKKVKEIQRNG